MARSDIIENIARNEPLSEEYATGRGSTNQTIVRSTAAPLDSTEIFFSELSARAYANGTLSAERNRFQYGSRSYVGQHIAVVNKELSTATLYQIQNTSGDLKKLLTSSDISVDLINGFTTKIATINIDGKVYELSAPSGSSLEVDGTTIVKNANNTISVGSLDKNQISNFGLYLSSSESFLTSTTVLSDINDNEISNFLKKNDFKIDNSTIVSANDGTLSVGTILSSQVQNIENLKSEASSMMLNGYQTPTSGGQILSTDTILSAISKLEYRIPTNNFVLTSSLPENPDPNTYYLVMAEDEDTFIIA